MRVLLVDDESLALDRLSAFFADIEGVEVVGRAADGNQALERIRELKPDLVIMDIQMPGKTGLRAAADIDIDPRPELVFVTAHEHYAPDAFEVDAADFAEAGPLRSLRQAVDRARRRRAQRSSAERAAELEAEIASLRSGTAVQPAGDDGFWIPERHGQRRVPLEAIGWIEAARDYVLLHTELRSHLLRITMAALEERLAGSALLRVHRSAFVRPDRVVEVKREGRSLALVLVDGAEVQVGPSYVAATKAALGME